MAWLSLALDVLAGGIFLLAPGMLLAKSLRFDTPASIASGPFISVSIYGIIATVLGKMGAFTSWATLLCISLLPAIIIQAIARLNRKNRFQEITLGEELCEDFSNHIKLPRWTICASAACFVSLITTIAVLLSTISGPDAFVQNYDNAFHLSHVQDFVTTGTYSSFTEGFYPSGWHSLAAMISSCTGCAVPEAALAADVVVIVFAYPLSSFLLLATLFGEKPRRVFIGCVVVTSIAFYPWRILLFGPLCSNLLAFSIMPAVASVFIRIFSSSKSSVEHGKYIILFLLGGVGLLFAQPNGVFSAGVFLAPFCIATFYNYCRKRRGTNHFVSFLLAVCLTIAFACLWIALLKVPGLRGVIEYDRDVPSTIPNAILRALSFSYVLPRAQLVAGTLTLLGIAVLFKEGGKRWLSVSYMLFIALFAVAYGWNSDLRKLFVGFWYSDYYRLAASACVFAIPVLATGIDAFSTFLLSTTRKIISNSNREQKPSEVVPKVATGCALLIAFLFNTFAFKFIPYKLRTYGFDAVRYETNLSYNQSMGQPLDLEEKEFLSKVKEIVPDGSLIVNQPFDGSAFAYPTEGLNVLFKRYNESNDPDVAAIANHLSEYKRSQGVKTAVEELDARYVLQLDYGQSPLGMNPDGTYYKDFYGPEFWHGINTVNETTPGFELILSENDMRLYRIER